MPNGDKNISGSLVLDLRIWWRHMKTLYKLKLNWNWTETIETNTL